MTQLNLRSMPDDWGECFTPQFISFWLEHGSKAVWLLRWFEKHKRYPNHKITTRDIFSELRVYMPRKKGSPNDNSKSSTNGNRGDMREQPIVWLNIRLTDDDAGYLEQSQVSFDELSAQLVALCADGVNISIKSIDRGETFAVTLIGSDLHGERRTYGLSGFGGQLRDALLVTLYKFDHYLGGDFANGAEFATDTQQSKRFR